MHVIYPAYKCQTANHFNIHQQDKFYSQLSMKKNFIISRPGLRDKPLRFQICRIERRIEFGDVIMTSSCQSSMVSVS